MPLYHMCIHVPPYVGLRDICIFIRYLRIQLSSHHSDFGFLNKTREKTIYKKKTIFCPQGYRVDYSQADPYSPSSTLSVTPADRLLEYPDLDPNAFEKARVLSLEDRVQPIDT